MELKVWEPSDADNLTNSTIFQITHEIRKGTGDPEQAKRLLKLFADCSSWAEAATLPEELFKHLKYAIDEYLEHPTSGKLESKLGLRRRAKGRPEQNRNRNHQIAWKVLQGMLSGESLEDTSLGLADVYSIRDNKIRDIWAEYKAQSLDFEAVYRAKKSNENKAIWSEREVKILRKIYGDYIK
jgi:hypothetical protein